MMSSRTWSVALATLILLTTSCRAEVEQPSKPAADATSSTATGWDGCSQSDGELDDYQPLSALLDEATDEARFFDPAPESGDFDGDGLQDQVEGWLARDETSSVVRLETGAGGSMVSEVRPFMLAAEIRSVRLAGATRDMALVNFGTVHFRSHELLAVQDCAIVNLGPPVPPGGGRSQQYLTCLDETPDGTILSTYFEQFDDLGEELVDKRHASWVIKNGALVETDLIERNIQAALQDESCFN